MSTVMPFYIYIVFSYSPLDPVFCLESNLLMIFHSSVVRLSIISSSVFITETDRSSLYPGESFLVMIMRSCCCCKVTTGSVVLGVLTLLATLAVMAPLVGYLADITDIPVLDVIKHNQKVMEKVLEGKCQEHTYSISETNNMTVRFIENARLDQG